MLLFGLLQALFLLMLANYSRDSDKSESRKHYFLWRFYSIWCITQSTFVNACLFARAAVSWIIYENYNIFTFLFALYSRYYPKYLIFLKLLGSWLAKTETVYQNHCAIKYTLLCAVIIHKILNYINICMHNYFFPCYENNIKKLSIFYILNTKVLSKF